MTAFCLAGVSGCAYKSLAGSSISYKLSPSLREAAEAAGEANLFVQGWLLRNLEQKNTELFVLALAPSKEGWERVSWMPVGASGFYGMYLPPATYQFAVYADLNKDGFLEEKELLGFREEVLELREEGPSVHFEVDIEIASEAPLQSKRILVEKESVEELKGPPLTVGEQLLAPRYGEEGGTLGMVNPNQFLQNYAEMQFIEEPDFTDDRIPVVFVHGIDGTPAVFDALEEKLDRGRFQSWFFYYPSGARLPSTAELLHRYFFSGRVLPLMKKAALTAHSMGGLVARAALNLGKGRASTPVALYSSFVTPYGGVEEANIGARQSPFRVPSWVDVASGSLFLKGLYHPLPKDTAFQLIAGNSEGDSDGTIRLSSQRFVPAINQASDTKTFPQSHVGIMSDPQALGHHLRLLDLLSPPKPALPPVGALERVRRAGVLFDTFHAELIAAEAEFRVMRVTDTLERLVIRRNGSEVVVQLAAGRNLRADIIEPSYVHLQMSWRDSLGEGVAATEGREEELLRRGEFLRSLMTHIASLSEGPPAAQVQKETPPAPLPVAPNRSTSYPPPVHLFAGLSGTPNTAALDFSLRVPVEFSMYFGSIGFGTDLRLPLWSPVIEAENVDLQMAPFGVGLGPRLRFGDRNALLVANLGANLAAEFGGVRMTEPGSGRGEGDEDVRGDELVGALGAYGSGHVGFRISQDFYLRFGIDLGSLFSNLSVDAEGEDVILMNPLLFNALAGIEIRIP